ncbi:ABC transporter ATP-binding protein [Atopobacter phocae]|uniref:ABC transporter ATP-binding protein n=1 Tax=Atopobacter phocae TaxID=136492 RepID=UPI000471C510|nr:ABC transporter ATP-binding protein [Atopobacter phocae]
MDVRFENVTMSYGDRNVLDDMSFVIPSDSLVSILGPSGCGKSTTLFLISGLTSPTKGKIFFGDEDVTPKDAVKRRVGMVFQNYALYPHLTVEENIMFPLKMERVPKKERKERAAELAKLVQIEEHLHKKPKQLSGGQQQRVAIARALAKRPAILLMDEPLSNLDARLRIEMREEIRRIQQETHITTIFVTHDQEEALSISDDVMVLNSGIMQQQASPTDLYQDPANLFIAQFIGNPIINTFNIGEEMNFEHALDFLPLEMKQLVATIGVRAEKWVITTSENSLLTGIIDRVEAIGKDVTIHVKTGNKMVTVVAPINTSYIAGETIHLTVDQQDRLLFDAMGDRIEVPN